MNSIKQQIDLDLKGYKFKGGVDDIFYKYKSKRIKKISASVVFVILVLSAIIITPLNLSGKQGLGISASALNIKAESTSVIGDKKVLIDNSGVKKSQRKVYYDVGHKELLGKTKGKFCGKKTVIVTSPVCLSVIGDNIKSYKINCKYGGIYNSDGDNLCCKTIRYKYNKTVNWTPCIDKLSKSLSADINMFPSTAENNELISRELTAKLKTAEDYTKYFGDTIKITALCDDNKTEKLSADITLDNRGRYYISVKK